MDKTISNFLLGQALSLLLSLSIVCREKINQNIKTQLLLEIVFNICLFSFSLIAAHYYRPKTDKPDRRLVALAAYAELAGDSLFFLSLKFMNNYMCTFFDELNYPISLIAEYAIYKHNVGSFLSVIAYVVLLLTTVGLCFVCSKNEYYFYPFGIITATSFNFCYILVAFLQTKLAFTMGMFGFTRVCSAYRFVTALLLLACAIFFRLMRFTEISQFFGENTANILFSSIFYAAFYILSTMHIGKFGVSAFFANLISSSIYVVLIDILLMPNFDMKVLFATPLCLYLIYILVRNGKSVRDRLEKTGGQNALNILYRP